MMNRTCSSAAFGRTCTKLSLRGQQGASFRRLPCQRQLHVVCSTNAPKVLLTREHGKNDKMLSALTKLNMHCIELPLIEHAPGPDRSKLVHVLKEEKHDWVAITSPESATVFLDAWNEAGKPQVRIAVVGGGTGEILQQAGMKPDFVATKATGKVMGAELPKVPGGDNRVLFPASAKASEDLQTSLEASGYSVVRLNTYNTIGVTNVPPEQLQQALDADVVTFGSPSAVKAWVALVGLQTANQKLNVCIGSTSARACDKVGLVKERVYYPEDPGIEGWVDCVKQAVKEHGLQAVSPAAH
mmetsp:Transcript_26764/g.58348  ORF Transcript_26764/g.58348 Transcript_26764/m.58348 type:complete len:299 (-) Transcript_26764:461-1357(-)|eukprot:CAMPEP_0202890750 /NCGR_PEP_ID=MMETSP1392-20130828/1060_1 /ASSEMBLY_ACC=CAM_ASM_000868 /TAXON_ID=225041 /ORGANISM="Chlamydomonas chlamydogama, Strain SAG 11-48b" /LENGTH=298 /DNA_ID=CAMNT_0049574377 /DNA_START=58 /DNA_END=954 /DNA_ORIENTATION=+